jgi:hypothetical protein
MDETLDEMRTAIYGTREDLDDEYGVHRQFSIEEEFEFGITPGLQGQRCILSGDMSRRLEHLQLGLKGLRDELKVHRLEVRAELQETRAAAKLDMELFSDELVARVLAGVRDVGKQQLSGETQTLRGDIKSLHGEVQHLTSKVQHLDNQTQTLEPTDSRHGSVRMSERVITTPDTHMVDLGRG